jgi:dTDP-4-dehydrorhamnose 3,5-epimerase/CDP-3, 6-dideoxy-D-glycero-D-glycero-4-hexulose-5-epimerase
MKFVPTSLSGAFEIELTKRTDSRGHFVKSYHQSMFLEAGIDFQIRESYFSVSHRNVLRGMHFQTNPHEHDKLVYCPKGKILDVILDLRSDSPTFGQYHVAELSEENLKAIFAPKGFAHGFLSLEDNSMTTYLLSSAYAPESDAGVLWNSFGFDWPCKDPIISERDRAFESFRKFKKYF